MTRAVPQTSTTQGKTSARKTKGQEKDFVTRLADAGEDALQRIAELPGGQRALGAFNDLRMRVDDLTKKVRGIDALEARVAKLEKQLAELKAPRRTTSRTTRKPSP
jgi:LPS O-antigen subunit length determinant protein (WzzB/FepE family)